MYFLRPVHLSFHKVVPFNMLQFLIFCPFFLNICRYIANITNLLAVASYLIKFPNFKNVLLFCFPFRFGFST